MKKLMNAILSFTLQNGLRQLSFAYVLVFSISIIFNQGYFLSTDKPFEVIHLIDFDAENNEENTEDEKTLNDLFFARNKASNDLKNGALLRSHLPRGWHSRNIIFQPLRLAQCWPWLRCRGRSSFYGGH